MPVALNTAMIAVSRRCAKLRPAHAWSSLASSCPVKTGISFAARSFNEPHYDFLNRSGDPFIEDIRRLIARWLSRMPSMHIADLQYRLQSKDDAEFESAFWELYLHEAYRRSGYRLTIHPAVSGTTRHPDFLVEDDGTRFYLEAVRACASASNTGENKRLEDARRVLAELR